MLEEDGEGGYELESGWVSFYEPATVQLAFPALNPAGRPPAGEKRVLNKSTCRKLAGRPPGTMTPDGKGPLYRSAYAVPIALDGDVGEWPEGVPWHVVSHEMGINSPTNDTDASFRVASVADEENLYLAIDITDDMKAVTNAMRLPLAEDDSLQLLIDVDGPGVPKDGSVDLEFTINRHHVLQTTPNGLRTAARQYVSHYGGARAAIVDAPDGWKLEVSVPFSTFGFRLRDEQEIGFNLVLNDYDAEDEEEHRLFWNSTGRLGDMVQNPQRLGSLQFINIR